jgi:cyclopropane fatty-acyl-phospholipid synthase-like methyltransferase
MLEPIRGIDGDLLEVGAGVGLLTLPIATENVQSTVWALDVSPKMLSYLPSLPNVRPVLGDGVNIPSEVPALAGAWSVVTMQHIPNETKAGYIAQIADRLLLGGVFRFQVVIDGDDGPISYPVDLDDALGVCIAAGLITSTEPDPVYPTWAWITGRKP